MIISFLAFYCESTGAIRRCKVHRLWDPMALSKTLACHICPICFPFHLRQSVPPASFPQSQFPANLCPLVQSLNRIIIITDVSYSLFIANPPVRSCHFLLRQWGSSLSRNHPSKYHAPITIAPKARTAIMPNISFPPPLAIV